MLLLVIIDVNRICQIERKSYTTKWHHMLHEESISQNVCKDTLSIWLVTDTTYIHFSRSDEATTLRDLG